MKQEKIRGDLFVDLLEAPFSRRGSFLAFANDVKGEDLIGKCTLWLCNCRINMNAMSSDLNASNGFRQVKLELVKDGKTLPALISTTPYEVVLESRHGSVRFCIGERKLVMCGGEDGLTLRVTPTPRFLLPSVVDLMEDCGALVAGFGVTRLLMMPVVGSLRAGAGFADMEPDENGVLRLALEEYMIDPVHRAAKDYPDYDACVKSVKADFDGYCARLFPSLPAAYEPKRLQALWQTWNMTVEPDGESDYKHTMVKMIHSIFEAAFVWQQPMQAVWLSSDLELAWNIFISGFDYLDANGRMVDALGYRASVGGEGLKPPVHGMALLWLMKRRDFASIPKESKETVWEGMRRWTEYFMKFRDKDHDGVAEFQNILETGWEDAPYYDTIGCPCASPDLNAFIALSMEAVAALGRDIGKPEEICAEWEKRSAELVGKIVEKFWDGERWFAFNARTGERSNTSTIPLYVPLILGRRLPQEIIDKSIEFMFGPDGFSTPYGLATEGVTSDYFKHGFTQGSIIVPAEFIMVLALEACGRSDLAARVANDYCAALRDGGFYHIHNALTGKGDRSLTAFGEPGLFWSAWASSCYLYLASEYGNSI
ncbi:MAG: hypothetical protein LBD92_01990 [Oscillospiraceae bacterium]|nr:hypothetical protein [Oscillospiraceae bacterium]